MILKEEALQIAEEAIRNRGIGTSIRSIYPFEGLPNLAPQIYGIDLRHHWIAYVERPIRGLHASLIVAVDRDFGVVRYVGSANDEG